MTEKERSIKRCKIMLRMLKENRKAETKEEKELLRETIEKHIAEGN